MEREQLLQNNSQFADQMVVRKLSTRHDGKREAYLTKCQVAVDGKIVDAPENHGILTVFNLKSKRYEVKFLRSRQSEMCSPKIIDGGIDKFRNRRFGWMLQRNINANRLTNEIRLRRGLLHDGCRQGHGGSLQCRR